jgi:hypothetical protein
VYYSFTPAEDLLPNSTYYWRARAWETKVCGSAGDYSPARAFVTSSVVK